MPSAHILPLQQRPPLLTLLFPLCLPGPSGHSSPLLASLPIPGRPLHPPLDIKHFLTFRLNGTSPLNLFPNFNTVSLGGGWVSAAGLSSLPTAVPLLHGTTPCTLPDNFWFNHYSLLDARAVPLLVAGSSSCPAIALLDQNSKVVHFNQDQLDFAAGINSNKVALESSSLDGQ